MATLTEVVAAVVVHSSAMALSHFGVAAPPVTVEKSQPAAERTVARTPPRKIGKISDCPDAQRGQADKITA